MIRIVRSIFAVVAGIVTWGLVSQAGVFAARAAAPDAFGPDGFTDSVPILLYMIVLGGVVCSLAAGAVTALLAGRRIMSHVVALSVIELGIGIVVQAMNWELAPLWYHLPFLALVVPMHLLGGWLVANRRGRPSVVAA
jgi:hypothetical protein